MSPGEIQVSLQAKVSSHLVLVPEKNVPTKSTRNYFLDNYVWCMGMNVYVQQSRYQVLMNKAKSLTVKVINLLQARNVNNHETFLRIQKK